MPKDTGLLRRERTRASRVGSALALGLVVAACAARPPLYYEYLEPAAAPAAAQPEVIEAPVEAVHDALVAGLRSGPFEVSAVDPERRFVVARYSGDPEAYLECGVILQVPRSGARVGRRAPAASASMQMVEDGSTYTRDLRLDGRLVVRLAPVPEGTAVDPEATYVVSKMIRRTGTDTWGLETIAFPSGGRAAFAKGTVCQPTGVLEQTAFAALERGRTLVQQQGPATAPADDAEAAVAERAPLPAIPEPRAPVLVEALPVPPPPTPVPDAALDALVASAVPEGSCGIAEVYRLGGDRTVVEGIASDLFAMDSMVNAIRFAYPDVTLDERVEVVSKGACEAYRLTELYDAAPATARLEVVGLRDGVLQEGEPLRLALGLPEARSHVHFTYFRGDGTVAHVDLETPQSLDLDSAWRVDTRLFAEPPYGREFVLALASDGPLFEEPRPGLESAREFLSALEAALARAADEAVVTGCAILSTAPAEGEPTPAVPAPDYPCSLDVTS